MVELRKNNHLEHLCCLVIDDDRFARNFTKTALYQIGFKNIKEAASATEAEEIIKNTKIDIIFTDQQMPEKTGLEMIADLIAIDPEFTNKIPVLMITSDTREATVLKAKELKIREYIIKPLSPAILKKRVFNILKIEEISSRD
jgi:two-component system chemotaxis response regulator CheY